MIFKYLHNLSIFIMIMMIMTVIEYALLKHRYIKFCIDCRYEACYRSSRPLVNVFPPLFLRVFFLCSVRGFQLLRFLWPALNLIANQTAGNENCNCIFWLTATVSHSGLELGLTLYPYPYIHISEYRIQSQRIELLR